MKTDFDFIVALRDIQKEIESNIPKVTLSLSDEDAAKGLTIARQAKKYRRAADALVRAMAVLSESDLPLTQVMEE